MRTKAIKQDSLNAILRLLTPENRLACLVALYTGLRISDVLNIKSEQVNKTRFVVQEAKTGKRKTIRLSRQLREKMQLQAGRWYVWPNRLDGKRPRTRQAVWKDLNRVGKMLKLKGLAPHSMRKTYARGLREQGFSETAIQRALNHSSATITRLYTMADELELK